MTISDEAVERAARETGRLQRELNITNADHIALWIEANTIPDEPMSQCASWLACRIVEAHEAALEASDQAEQIKALEDRLATAREALEDIGVYGCGMLSQPVGLNAPPAQWMQKRIERMEQVARAALDAIKEKNGE